MKKTGIPPEELTKLPQWVSWRYEDRGGKPTKVPISPITGRAASCTNSATWSDYRSALRHSFGRGLPGVGFVFAEGDPYAGIDLDRCRNPLTELIEPWADRIVNDMTSYTEITPSGTGLHIIVEGVIPPGGNRSGHIEMYDRRRYFTVTGNRLRRTPAVINQRREELRALHERIFPPQNRNQQPDRNADAALLNISDQEILEKARRAANGGKFEMLWVGEWQKQYPSQSEADLALCAILAFWTGGNAARVDALFRQSGLMRAKWDRRHFNDGKTYGEATVETACRRL